MAHRVRENTFFRPSAHALSDVNCWAQWEPVGTGGNWAVTQSLHREKIVSKWYTHTACPRAYTETYSEILTVTTVLMVITVGRCERRMLLALFTD